MHLSTIISLIYSDVPIIQCTFEYEIDLNSYTECEFENSCILANLKTDENSASYEVNRTQIHEFECLIFTNSFIQKIPSNIFIATRSKIAHLYANNVSISELSRNSFLIANQLINVDLSWNALQKLQESAFYDAINLLSLNLSHNKITDFSQNVFEKLDKLQTLDLSFNHITAVPFELFQPLRNLKTLNLRENRLQLKFGIFPKRLRTLDLSYNNLEFQQKFKIFALLEYLETFLLHGKLICIVLISTYQYHKFEYFFFFLFNKHNFEGNRIESIDSSILDSKNVKFLGLSENLFTCNVLADIILNMRVHSKEPIVENIVEFTSNIDGIRCIE